MISQIGLTFHLQSSLFYTEKCWCAYHSCHSFFQKYLFLTSLFFLLLFLSVLYLGWQQRECWEIILKIQAHNRFEWIYIFFAFWFLFWSLVNIKTLFPLICLFISTIKIFFCIVVVSSVQHIFEVSLFFPMWLVLLIYIEIHLPSSYWWRNLVFFTRLFVSKRIVISLLTPFWIIYVKVEKQSLNRSLWNLCCLSSDVKTSTCLPLILWLGNNPFMKGIFPL